MATGSSAPPPAPPTLPTYIITLFLLLHSLRTTYIRLTFNLNDDIAISTSVIIRCHLIQRTPPLITGTTCSCRLLRISSSLVAPHPWPQDPAPAAAVLRRDPAPPPYLRSAPVISAGP
ncbi:hypothetical protein NPIL_472821 [Nephila pilipes]|uniref:Uncharacterized protein n=1 Tax=Nephila pilipes TaxID=299642 RepID=A0A8X6R2G0_NEPPI|nr:hypothetical protein NPIL_472821 [Nephila pilipes]